MFLCIVAEPGSVAQDPLPHVGLLQPGEKAQHRGFSGSVQSEDDHLGSLVDGEVDGGEHLQ